MSLVMTESCDLPNLLGFLGQKWVGAVSVSSDDTTIDTRRAWRLADFGYIQTTFPDKESATVVAGTRLYTVKAGTLDANRPFMRFLEGGVAGTLHVWLGITGSDIRAYRGTGTGTVLGTTSTAPLATSNWVYVETKVVINDTTGSVTIKVDGVEVLALTGIDTRNGGTDGLIDAYWLGGGNTNPYIRDIIIMNGSGSYMNDFVGPVAIEAVLPNGAGDLTGWTPNAGANWQAVDDPDPDGDTTYVEATAAAEDTYAFPDLSTISTDPLAVTAYCVGRYNSSPLNIATMVRRSSINDFGTPVVPTGSYATRGYSVWETDPIAASAWTLANVNASQFGIQASV